MIITFGKKKGVEVGKVLLKDPDYIAWALNQSNSGPMGALQTEAKRLIAKFGTKPLTTVCHGCKGNATYFTAYANNANSLYSWCDTCNPYSSGANPGKLTSIRSFSDAMAHIAYSCGNLKKGKTAIVKAMAEAKGLPKRVGDAEVAAFFA